MQHACNISEIHIPFWYENVKRRDHMEELGVDGRIIILKRKILRKFVTVVDSLYEQ
jgi:hypothetical protein